MAEWLAQLMTGVALFILLTVALGLARILRAEAGMERMMAVQLLGTGGAAAALLLAAAAATPAIIDVALLLMLLAAFSCAAFAMGEDEEAETAVAKEDGP